MALRVRDGDTSGKRSIQRGRERAMETRATAIRAGQRRHKWAMVRAMATVGQRVFCKGSSYLSIRNMIKLSSVWCLSFCKEFLPRNPT